MHRSLIRHASQAMEYPLVRVSGVWLLLIGTVIAVATLVGGRFELNPFVFMVGYGVSLFVTEFHPYVKTRFAGPGELNSFQKKMARYGDIYLFPLMFIMGGSFIPSGDWRMVWLGTLLATGIHFLLFVPVHGKPMAHLSLLCSTIALAGMLLSAVPFLYFGLLDGAVKMAFGIYLVSRRSSNQPPRVPAELLDPHNAFDKKFAGEDEQRI